MLGPAAVVNFSKNSGKASLAKKGEADIHPLRATLRSSAVIPYGSLGGGRNDIGK
jgi:hypothetical protein